MFAAGTPLVEAMTSVAGACGNIVFYTATMKMKDEISTGTQLQASMRDTGLFPNMVVQMVAIGEESGAIDTMLGKVADWYEQEVDDAVEALTSLLEPMIMAFLGVGYRWYCCWYVSANFQNGRCCIKNNKLIDINILYVSFH